MLSDGSPLHVIDVRERYEFEAGHLDGSVHIGKGVLERDIEKHQFAEDARLSSIVAVAFVAQLRPVR